MDGRGTSLSQTKLLSSFDEESDNSELAREQYYQDSRVSPEPAGRDLRGGDAVDRFLEAKMALQECGFPCTPVGCSCKDEYDMAYQALGPQYWEEKAQRMKSRPDPDRESDWPSVPDTPEPCDWCGEPVDRLNRKRCCELTKKKNKKF